MNRLGAKSNTGEGGEDPERFDTLPDGDSKRSSIKQVASGRFGVTSEYLVNADDIQIKMAQGAKPGEGGQLPGHKVYPWVAKTRHSTPGVGLISPPPHHDIYSIEDLAQLIHDLKNANPRRPRAREARGRGRRRHRGGRRRQGARRRGAHLRPRRRHRRLAADVPQARRRTVGARARRDAADPAAQRPARPRRRADRRPAQDRARRRDRRAPGRRGVRVRDGTAGGDGLRHDAGLSPRHLPGGRRHPEPRAARALHRPARVRRELLRLHRRGGTRAPRRARLPLDRRGDRSRRGARHLAGGAPLEGWRASTLPRSCTCPRCPRARRCARRRLRTTAWTRRSTTSSSPWPPMRSSAASRCARRCASATSTARSGTMLGSQVTRRYGADGLPDDTIDITFTGSAGQSFGAFLPRGITLRLEGDANDYVGKGLSGGRIIVRPDRAASFVAEDNVIAGNVIGYGATSGEIFVRGVVGERFCVRNSGAVAVVEGVGDHGCEYMTGGRVVVLGTIGRNLAAGMSGGVAYLLDAVTGRINTEMVDLVPLDDDDVALLRDLLTRHHEETDSSVAAALLAGWCRRTLHQDHAPRLRARPGRPGRSGARGPRRPPRRDGGDQWLTRRAFSPPVGRRRPGARSTCGSATGARSTKSSRPTTSRSRPAAAWTAASRSATTAARSATSSPSGTTWCGGRTGSRRASGCMPRTTSRSSPVGCARRRARPPACSASIRTPSRSSRSRSRSSTAPGTRAGSRRHRHHA